MYTQTAKIRQHVLWMFCVLCTVCTLHYSLKLISLVGDHMSQGS